MKNEIYWLTLTTIATALFWVPYILDRIREHALIPALRNPNRDSRPESEWANRMMYAHQNAVENLVLFAPLVLIIEILNISNETTTTASMVYFFTRIAHALLYTFGIPYFRTLAFFIGFIVQVILGLTILNAI